jgi:hypothetical protein
MQHSEYTKLIILNAITDQLQDKIPPGNISPSTSHRIVRPRQSGKGRLLLQGEHNAFFNATLDSEYQLLSVFPLLSVAPGERSRGTLQSCRSVGDDGCKVSDGSLEVGDGSVEVIDGGCMRGLFSLSLGDRVVLRLDVFDCGAVHMNDVIDLVLKFLFLDLVMRLKVLKRFGRRCVPSLDLRNLLLQCLNISLASGRKFNVGSIPIGDLIVEGFDMLYLSCRGGLKLDNISLEKCVGVMEIGIDFLERGDGRLHLLNLVRLSCLRCMSLRSIGCDVGMKVLDLLRMGDVNGLNPRLVTGDELRIDFRSFVKFGLLLRY